MTIKKGLWKKELGGSWFASVKDCVDTTIQGLESFMKKSKEITYNSQ